MQRAKLANRLCRTLSARARLRGHPLFRARRSTWTAETIRSHLRRLELQEGIARYLARKIAELTDREACPRVRQRRLPALRHQTFQLATQSATAGGRADRVQLRRDLQRLRAPLCTVPRHSARRPALRQSRHDRAGRVQLAVPRRLPEAEWRHWLLSSGLGGGAEDSGKERSTGSSRPKDASGRAPRPRTQPCATGVPAFPSKPTSNGSTLASIRLISRHECHEPWPRQYRAWLYFKTTGTKRKSPASWPA